MKRFKLVSLGESSNNSQWLGQVHSIEIAALAGYGLNVVGHQILDSLAVGETTIDDDGDTWERVE